VTPFVIIVVKKVTLTIFVVRDRIPGYLVVEVEDKTLITKEVKVAEVVLIGNLSRETEECPCLVAK